MELLKNEELNKINGGFNGWEFAGGVIKVIRGGSGVLIPYPVSTFGGFYTVASGVADIIDSLDDE